MHGKTTVHGKIFWNDGPSDLIIGKALISIKHPLKNRCPGFIKLKIHYTNFTQNQEQHNYEKLTANLRETTNPQAWFQ